MIKDAKGGEIRYNLQNMKSVNIVIILAFVGFVFSEFGICFAEADHCDDHCLGCCSFVCCQAITPLSSSIVTDLTVVSKIFYPQIPFTQSPFLKGLDRPPRTPLI